MTHQTSGVGYRQIGGTADVELFVLNETIEHPPLVEVLRRFVRARQGRQGLDPLPLLASAAEELLRGRLIRAFADPLDGDALRRLDDTEAVEAVRDRLNWWRDENDKSISAASTIVVLSIADRGRTALASSSP